MEGRRGALEFQFTRPTARSVAAAAVAASCELLLLDEGQNELTIFGAGWGRPQQV